MAIEVPRLLVEFILLGPADDRRQLQDSPILGDVWIAFAKNPDTRLELLITPYKEQAAGRVATVLADQTGEVDANIAYLQGIVAASLTFEEVLRFVVPMTSWWNEKRIADAITKYISVDGPMEKDINEILQAAGQWLAGETVVSMQDREAHKRYVTLAGLILWAEDQPTPSRKPTSSNLIKEFQKRLRGRLGKEIVKKLRKLLASEGSNRSREGDKSLVWHVSLNRTATPALTKSVPSVKADAARTLFTVDCREIAWAVIDSGIDATHPAFRDKSGETCRVKRSFDFTRIREIVSLDNIKPDKAKERIDKLFDPALMLKRPPKRENAEEELRGLAEDARKGRAIDWELVESLVEIDPARPAASDHGTHVAGIIGADKRAVEKMAKKASGGSEVLPADDWSSGMCPDIQIYDFRVLAPSLRETEFAIIAALQYIRYINERNSYITIHGANLSLSIRHDVRNYACGRTPVCNECERLVNSGVVVVAAAGNRGYQNFETDEGVYEGYAAFSITDPGNADGVITVGSTHRSWPHTYGVSFFSSRGPTGDGRLKPDLVAPGERIRAPLPGNVWGDLDGTSMAAPHVSGAAAMLMARYSELVGQPRRIKKILCDSATDLGRERTFQGYGMLDVLRAFQSI